MTHWLLFLLTEFASGIATGWNATNRIQAKGHKMSLFLSPNSSHFILTFALDFRKVLLGHTVLFLLHHVFGSLHNLFKGKKLVLVALGLRTNSFPVLL